MPRLRMKSNSSRSTSSKKTTSSRMKAPPHPFPLLQGPFEESMTELERLEETEVPSDAASRRTILLDAPTYQRVIAGRWRQRPGEKYHPLWKIIAQLSFGVHLLAENLAKSEEEVTHILQGHIDEIDLFLERTTEDFALAQDDIKERMRCLQLPLQHPKVFDRMLEDRAFRNSIVDGNEKIEHIVSRTSAAMKDALKDAQKGLDATNALAQYLDSLDLSQGRRNTEHEAIFEAMLENVEGWRGAFIDIHEQGDSLGLLLGQLTEVINQMNQRASEVSRRLVLDQQKSGVSPNNSNNITYISRQSVSSGSSRAGTPDQPPRKPLPGVPNRESGRQLTSPAQRSETAQSTRSAVSYMSNNVQSSRVSSREGRHSNLRDSGQTRLSTKSPRLVEIRRKSPQGLEIAQGVLNSQHENPRVSARSLPPIELPTESPRSTMQINPLTDERATTPNLGLGIMQDRGESQLSTEAHNSNPAVTRVTTDPTAPSMLPSTPNSMKSNEDQGNSSIHQIASGMATRSELALVVPNVTTETSLGSPPSTPGWAKVTFDTRERQRMVIDKTAFRSHPPNADFGSPPVLNPVKFEPQSQSHHARMNASIASSLGAPGPEVASSPVKSIKSTHLENGNPKSAPPVFGLTSVAESSGPQPGLHGDKKVFVAELEGNLPSNTREDSSLGKDAPKIAREVTHEMIELEAPLQQPHPVTARQNEGPVMASTSNGPLESFDAMSGFWSPSSPTISRKASSSTNHGMVATAPTSLVPNIVELPGESSHKVSVYTDRAAAPRSENKTLEAMTHKGDDEMLVQLDHVDSRPLNSGLQGNEVLLMLPATTYVAEQRPVSRSHLTPPQALQSLSRSTGTLSNVGTSPSMADVSRRNSNESTASSQSQWRAFFKGQLSPAEFSNSTPKLPSKGSVAHKAIIELQRREQEASPTLGWQWAPETPDVERKSFKRTIS